MPAATTRAGRIRSSLACLAGASVATLTGERDKYKRLYNMAMDTCPALPGKLRYPPSQRSQSSRRMTIAFLLGIFYN